MEFSPVLGWRDFFIWRIEKMVIFNGYMAKRKLTPFSEYILKLDKPLETTISAGSLDLYLDPTWHPEQHVTVTGTVYAVPKENPYNLSISETVCFSYQVVADRDFDDTPDHYHPYVDEENLKIFYNGKNEKIQIRAVQGLIAKKFVCVHWDKTGEFDFGYEGTANEADRWLSQFKFGNTDRFRFKNCIDLDGEILWKCRPEEIFAKKVGKKLISVGNKLILNPIKMQLKPEDFEKNGLVRPDSTIELIAQDVAKVENAPTETGLKKGDTIAFDGKYIEKYSFFGRNYILINQDRIMGQWN